MGQKPDACVKESSTKRPQNWARNQTDTCIKESRTKQDSPKNWDRNLRDACEVKQKLRPMLAAYFLEQRCTAIKKKKKKNLGRSTVTVADKHGSRNQAQLQFGGLVLDLDR